MKGVAGLLTADPQMLSLVQQVSSLAKHPVSVLLEGESGTGKELFARSIHIQGMYQSGAFVAINCAAIPEGLLESELFGHEKGAFTGAVRQVTGKIQAAHGGVLFLDEIGDLPIALQPKLLRFLEQKTIERIGGRESIPVQVRIVAATHQPLAHWITQGTFRADLYYRLAETVLFIPPLRNRNGDVLLLAWHFLKKFTKEASLPDRNFSHEALAAMEQHSWPGNVRELQNRVKRAVLLANHHFIEPSDLGLTFERPVLSGLSLKCVRHEAEQAAILRALSYVDHNLMRAAALLEISRPTLYHLMEKYQISIPQRETNKTLTSSTY